MKTNKIKFGISYVNTGSMLHSLNGITKFLLFMGWVTMVLITFDIRVILGLIGLGLWLLKQSRVPFQVYKPLLVGTTVVLMMNALFMFLIAPQQGMEYMGTQTVLLALPGSYSITAETLFYLATVTLKYFSMFPIALVFVFTTHPTEFSASLNKLGVPYRIAYAVSLTLRYLPEVTKDFINIMHAQQARGVDISKDVPVFKRIRNVAKILGPLIFSSLDRADVISNAMTLRGFGRNTKRSWYSLKPLQTRDYVVLATVALVLAIGLMNRYQSESLFWYPFS
ncbi:energy-coupling factor transporter transmembrane component T family protein [Photobacterium sanguinicancri]|uniref:energy-coupling factor transporter transmembrane component T family protein n=1 Tax=Photobacterium sanguinicancri TaxID=875932 RepID=UPI0026E16B9E|nr:energy-coupling factor transporter transmembrane component T [Photobacterium sanguinicancri]MDO6498634.1 energy-coupling factor transporter transmembrane component T [Photobacterium sanguinicancri]